MMEPCAVLQRIHISVPLFRPDVLHGQSMHRSSQHSRRPASPARERDVLQAVEMFRDHAGQQGLPQDLSSCVMLKPSLVDVDGGDNTRDGV